MYQQEFAMRKNAGEAETKSNITYESILDLYNENNFGMHTKKGGNHAKEIINNIYLHPLPQSSDIEDKKNMAEDLLLKLATYKNYIEAADTIVLMNIFSAIEMIESYTKIKTHRYNTRSKTNKIGNNNIYDNLKDNHNDDTDNEEEEKFIEAVNDYKNSFGLRNNNHTKTIETCIETINKLKISDKDRRKMIVTLLTNIK